MKYLQTRDLNICKICMCLIIFEMYKSVVQILLQTYNLRIPFKPLIIDRIVRS